MTRWRSWIITIVVLLLGSPLWAQATGMPVYDAAADIQAKFDAVKRIAESAREYAQQLEQYRQGAQQLIQMVTAVEQGAKQLASMPQGLGVFEMVDHLTTQSNALLGKVQGIGFTLDTSTKQFEALYLDVAKATTPEGRALLFQRAQDARLEMLGVSMQVQSVRQTFAGIYDRLKALLTATSLVEGVKAVGQVQVHQAALAAQQQQLGLTMQAVSGRLDAMRDAEAILRERLTNQQASEDASVWYARHTRTLPPGFSGFAIRGR